MKIKIIVITAALILLKASFAGAEIRVAFIESYDHNNKLVQLEPDGRFSHVAIAVQDQWLHAHPQRGVELTTDLSDQGRIKEVLVKSDLPSLRKSDVKNFLGLRYDWNYKWEDAESSYCSKILVTILNTLLPQKIDPIPALFKAAIWQGRLKVRVTPGAVGVSPDDLYSILKGRGFSVGCSTLFHGLKEESL